MSGLSTPKFLLWNNSNYRPGRFQWSLWTVAGGLDDGTDCWVQGKSRKIFAQFRTDLSPSDSWGVCRVTDPLIEIIRSNYVKYLIFSLLLLLRLTAWPVLTAPQFVWREPKLISVLENTGLSTTQPPLLRTNLCTATSCATDISTGIQLKSDGRLGRTYSLSLLKFTQPMVGLVKSVSLFPLFWAVQTAAIPVSPGRGPGWPPWHSPASPPASQLSQTALKFVSLELTVRLTEFTAGRLTTWR